MTGDGRRLLVVVAAVAAGAVALAGGTHSINQRAVTKEVYYEQLRIVLYDTREALQFSIREAVDAKNPHADLAGAAMKALRAKVAGVRPPGELRGAHARLEDAMRIASDELINAPPTPNGRITRAVLAERRINDLIMLTTALERRESDQEDALRKGL